MRVSDAIVTAAEGAEIRVVCQPRAARDKIGGMHGGRLRVKVRAPALEGRANEALLGLLAEALGVPRRQVRLVGGERSRVKRVGVTGLGAGEVARRIEACLAGRQPPR